ncbi:sulfite exporter TauE/SafE family protein [Youngiibacter fragilis]|uniref:sulfite exporter TauE/SafE family protein n=1 Tax=Youngiibacter fragilis TaxID=1408819 RepID=UPI001FA78382|nr:TSUP family transporter [Youngiibacter fragilis]
MLFKMIFLCSAGFLAAFVDSIAGGGGLISLPAYLFAGVPPHFALGTNKFASTSGSFLSTLGYARSNKINFRLLRFAVPATVLGAALGVRTVLLIPQDFLSPFVSVMILVVGLYTVFKKGIGEQNNFTTITRRKVLFGTLVGFTLGFYDGFFGPGTGSFLIFIFIRFFRYDFINASGNAKLINFTSNITSLVMFALNGKIDYAIGIPVALFMMAGSTVGTRLAIRNGSKFIRPIFITMSIAVFVKLVWQMTT